VKLLVRGIQEFRGGIVLVSHDRRLIEATPAELLVVQVRRARFD
jgi:ATPase subunit of ABC transporter with duplicated ATPase domains